MAFTYYKSVTIDHTQCGATDSTDFPVAIWITDADLKTIANGGKVQNSNGYDIRPYADAALTIPLNFELVASTYVPTTGAFEMHVKIPTVSHTSDTVFYLAFGDSGISTDGSSTATWNSDYYGVWHFPNGTSLTLGDSTSTGLNMTGTNTPTATTGQLDGGMNLVSASTQSAQSANMTLPGGTSRKVTMSAWVKATSFPNAYNLACGKDNGTFFWVIMVKSTGKLACYITPSTGGNINYDGTGSHTLSASTWYYLTLVYSSTVGLIGYVNASSDGTGAANGFLQDPNSPFVAGVDLAFAGRNWNGVLDEIRISSIIRSADWITTEYNNQKPSSTFLSFGALTPVSGGSSPGNFFLIFN